MRYSRLKAVFLPVIVLICNFFPLWYRPNILSPDKHTKLKSPKTVHSLKLLKDPELILSDSVTQSRFTVKLSREKPTAHADQSLCLDA